MVAGNMIGHAYVAPLAQVIDKINICFSKMGASARLTAPQSTKKTAAVLTERARGHEVVMRLLLEEGADVHAYITSPR